MGSWIPEEMLQEVGVQMTNFSAEIDFVLGRVVSI